MTPKELMNRAFLAKAVNADMTSLLCVRLKHAEEAIRAERERILASVNGANVRSIYEEDQWWVAVDDVKQAIQGGDDE